MASIVTHAALPLLGERALPSLPMRRRLAIAAVVCGCLPDLDLIGLLFDIRPSQPLGHQGLLHSLLAAAVIGLAAAALAFRPLKIGSHAWWSVAAFLAAVTAVHGLADAMTANEIGVAFFAPLSWKRYFLLWRPLPICPLGLPEFFGRWGVVVILNEIVFLLAPAFFLSHFARLWQLEPKYRARSAGKLGVGAAACFALAFFARASIPALFVRGAPRPLHDAWQSKFQSPALIPHGDLPGARLVTRFDELEQRGLLGSELRPEHVPWSSSFFPDWYGSESGRWQESKLRLIWRTLFGMAPPTAAQAERWLAAAAAGDPAARQRLFTLAPTEKIDIADGDLSFPMTRASLAWTHNGTPRYWYGRCNGIAAAALFFPEPFRVVEVIGKTGAHLRFHPNDVKALLATAFYTTHDAVPLGAGCEDVVSLEPDSCVMNPASLVLALTNRLGLTRRSFLVDVPPAPASQFYAVAEARVTPLGPPRPLAGEPLDPSLRGKAKSLVDVAIELTFSSTTLPYGPADRLDPAAPDGSRYLRVGVDPVHFSYAATLALGADTEILGGAWTGVPGGGPKSLVFPGDTPALAADGKTLAPPEVLSWPLIERLAVASASPDPADAVVDLRTPDQSSTAQPAAAPAASAALRSGGKYSPTSSRDQ